jgi:putative inorganic carbon (HCO3(-)) transporter
MPSKSSSNIIPVVFMIRVAAVSVVLFSFFHIKQNWWVALNLVFCVLVTFQFIRDKELFLLQVLALFLPFGVGFLYSEMLKADLVWAFDTVLVVLLYLWFTETRGFKKSPLRIHKSTVWGFMFLVWSVFGLIGAVAPLGVVHAVFYQIKSFIIYLYIINRIKNRSQMVKFVNMLIFGLVLQGGLGVIQRIAGRSLGLAFLGEKQGSLWSKGHRITGTMAFPNQYGAYLIELIPLAASLFVFSKKSKSKFWYLTAAVLGIFGLLFSLSRSSWVGLLLGIVVMWLVVGVRQKLNARLVGGLLAVVISISLIIYFFWDTIAYRVESGEGAESRILMIKIAIPIILSHPLFGVGLANYAYYSYGLFRFWSPVHNEYLRIAAETGIPGLFFFMGFLVLIFREIFRNLKSGDTYIRAVSAGVLGGYTSFLFSILLGPEYQYYRQQFLFWILAGIVVSLRMIARREIQEKKNGGRRPGVGEQTKGTGGLGLGAGGQSKESGARGLRSGGQNPAPGTGDLGMGKNNV